MMASERFIYAEVVDIESLYLLKIVAVGMVFHHAEAVAGQDTLIIDAYKYGSVRIRDDILQLGRGILGATVNEEIRASVGMDIVDLMQEIHDFRAIPLFRFPNI